MFKKHITKLALISVAFLFLELVFIRLIGTEIRIFAYVANIILLAVFMGSSVGMFMTRKIPLVISLIGITLLALLLAFDIFSSITGLIAPLHESVIWHVPGITTSLGVVWGFIQVAVLLLLVIAIFAPIGQYVGGCFHKQKYPVILYSLNIFFSVVGLWLFYLFSSLNVSPYAGTIVGAVFLCMLIFPRYRLLSVSCLVLITAAYLLSMTKGYVEWSPYQKLGLAEETYSSLMPKQKTILVNNVGFMSLPDLSEKNIRYYEELLTEVNDPELSDLKFKNIYDTPYLIKPGAKNVLILGAGGGNDVAAALRASVDRVDAVEIDPVVISLGKKHHPEKPYSDPRVNIIIDDGRSFLKKSARQYDVIVMGFLDSHTTNSTITNVQLDNYMYTAESFRETEKILAPDGIIYVSFGVYHPWVGERLYQAIAGTYKQPVVYSVDEPFFGGGTIFIGARDSGLLNKKINDVEGLAEFIAPRLNYYSNTLNSLTDDWPYLYLQSRNIPKTHIVTGIILVVIFISLTRGTSSGAGFLWPPFLLGAGFMLLEFMNITRTSLIFGNTWVTNLYAITGVLVMSLAANLLYIRHSGMWKYMYACLFISLITITFVPLSSFNVYTQGWKTLITTLFLSSPLFFSSYLFVWILSRSKNKRMVLASNFAGSFAGGMTSFLSYISGISLLLFIAMGIYIASFILLQRRTPNLLYNK